MPTDLASQLMRKSIGALSSKRRSCCSGCNRSLVSGELMHVFESDGTLCTLCAARLPDDTRPLRSERVYVADRHVFAVPRAA